MQNTYNGSHMTVSFAGERRLGFSLTFITSFPAASWGRPKLNLNWLVLTPVRRNYSTKLPEAGPVKYVNADVEKLRILTENRDKSGVYMWTNLINGKRYIGSSVNLKRRFLEYYNVNRLLNAVSMTISKALLKHGYSNFSLEILEYCSPDELMAREKYYLDSLKPEYNILKEPGSPSRGSGWKHTEETKLKLSLLVKSEETIAKFSEGQRTRQKIEVTDLELNVTTEYHAIRAAARALDIDRRYIENYINLNQTEPVKGRYTFKRIGEAEVTNVGKQATSQKIEVTDLETNEVSVYASMGSAANSLGVRQAAISLYLKEGRKAPYRKRYIIKRIDSTETE